MAWLTTLDAREEPYWPGPMGDPIEDTALDRLLTSARTQCETYAPTLAEGADVPETYRLAQSMQARALWRAGEVGSGDQMGADGLTVTVFPMDWTVKNLLRPRSGRFKVR